MKSYLKGGIIVLVSSALGYQLYPILNDTKQDISQFNNSEQSKNSEHSQVSNLGTPDTLIIQESKALSNTRKMSDESETMTTQKIEHTTKLSNDISEDYSIEKTYAKEELKQWSIEHKEKLNQIIDDNMPVSISSVMKSSIGNNNQMLNDPSLQQDHIEDDNWTYLMEQDMRAYITQHELAAGFELLNISCKQLICDVIGIEREANVWFQIYRGFYSFPNILFPKDGNRPLNIVRMDNGIPYIYAQIMFKAHKSS
ncbi:hypothetical protein tinsulaeT_35960 [Thalassotalea insulae]|uniref:Uncharacterized protein n=1 Tax=Thalassotalea insulae TaxID=2056778 RepID=A0ABQ6H1G0_9GAMM|nr:hypothetical protein [Thalassotalea insulae]GLX80256.1 hypothetical protein tinsulaeT_35960 [Thalassotalea insulae]